MDSEKAPTSHLPGRFGDEPDERRRHNFRLDHLGAIEADSSDTMVVLVIPPGTGTLTATPVPSRSFAARTFADGC